MQTAPAAGGNAPSLFSMESLPQLLLPVLLLVLFYFMLIRPQQRRAKQHRELIALDYTHDRLANQYRRTQKQPSTYRDGVLIQGGEPDHQPLGPELQILFRAAELL